MEPDPPKLDYRPPEAAGVRGWAARPWARYVLGVITGMGFSLVYYLGLGTMGDNPAPLALLGAVLIKLVVGVVLVFSPRWRAFGLGLITSAPIAVLLLVGLCFGLIAMN